MTYAWVFPAAYLVGGIATGCWAFKIYFELPQERRDELDLTGSAWFIMLVWPLFLPPLVGSALAKAPAPVDRNPQGGNEVPSRSDESAVPKAGAQVDPTQEETR